MAVTVDGVELSAKMVAALGREIENLPVKALKQYADGHPELGLGDKVSARRIVECLRAELNEDGEFDRDLATLLAASGLNIKLVAVFSIRALELIGEAMCACWGWERVVPAFLVDEREEVRALGLGFAGRREEVEWAEEGGCLFISEVLGPFLTLMRPVAAASGVAAAAPPSPRETRKNNGKREKALQNKIDRLQGEVKELKARLDKEKKTASGLRREMAALNREHEDLLAAMETEVGRRVEKALSGEMRRWLAAAREEEALLRALEDKGDLLARVEKALRSQEEADRRCGNRARLAARLAALTAARRKLVAAARSSFAPAPALRALNTEVEKEIAAISAQLGEQEASDPVSDNLLLRIRAAASPDGLQEVAALIRRLAADSVLPAVAVAALEEEIAAARERFYDRYAPAPNQGRERDFAARLAGARLLVDGYNALLNLPEQFARVLEADGRPGEAARRDLIAKLDAVCRRYKVEADLFFDGPEAREESATGAVRVIFSGGGTAAVAGRADRVIIDRLETRMPGDGGGEIVVSNDQEVCARSRELGARTMGLSEFDALLRAAGRG